jgi:hypothetical protein
MEPAIAIAMPRYLPAAAAARVFIFAAGAGGITTLGAIGVVAVGKQRLLPMLSAFALAINLACSMLAFHLDAGLSLVAGGAVLAQATIATGVLVIVGSQAGRPLMLVAKGMLPLAWCVATVVLMGRVYDSRSIAGGAESIATYLLLLLPISPLMLRGWHSARGQTE